MTNRLAWSLRLNHFAIWKITLMRLVLWIISFLWYILSLTPEIYGSFFYISFSSWSRAQIVPTKLNWSISLALFNWFGLLMICRSRRFTRYFWAQKLRLQIDNRRGVCWQPQRHIKMISSEQSLIRRYAFRCMCNDSWI